ncbi:MAG: cupredoxin domain-containing protein [Patescibacteria group bacterium]
MDKAIVLVSSLGLIGFIYWFFLGKREKTSEISTDIKITVSGGYSPESITIPVGKPVKITLIRTDPTDCLEEFVIPDLKIKKTLPLNTPVTIAVTVTSPGRYGFHCGMNMYHGQIIAR